MPFVSYSKNEINSTTSETQVPATAPEFDCLIR